MFLLNEDRELILHSIKSLLDGINPYAPDEEAIEDYTFKLINKLYEEDYFSMAIPEQYQGADLEYVSAMLILKEIAKIDAGIAHILGAHSYGFCRLLRNFGSKELQDKVFWKMKEEKKIGTFALTEPNGSNLGNLELQAKRVENGYVLNGTKAMVTYGRQADYAMIFGLVGKQNYTIFLCPLKKQKGITFGKVEKTMGMESAQIAEINFEDYFLSYEYRLGEEGQGIEIMCDMLAISRITNGAIALGLAEKAVDLGIGYTKERRLNGRPLIEHINIKFTLAEAYSRLSSIQLIVMNAAEHANEKCDLFEASIVKYEATEAAKKICDSMMQMHGGNGYLTEYEIERLYRDVRLHTIVGGSSELLLDLIGNCIIEEYEQLVQE